MSSSSPSPPCTSLSVTLTRKSNEGHEVEERVWIFLPEDTVSAEDLADIVHRMRGIVVIANELLAAVNVVAPVKYGCRIKYKEPIHGDAD